MKHGEPERAGADKAPALPGDSWWYPVRQVESSEPPGKRETSRGRRWKFPGMAAFIALICLIGAGLLLYPSTAAWWAQYNQSKVIDAYNDSLTRIGPEQRAAALDEAEAYNADLGAGRAVVGAGQRIPTSDGTTSDGWDYNKLLRAADNGLMARIKIPSIDVDLPIYHGTTDQVLLEGVGHLEGTALPVGGDSTHSVLTGHRGLASATLFSDLDKVGIGDRFIIEVFNEVVTYLVVETQVVEPDDTQTLQPQEGRDLLTLVTCTPVGINSHRILVTGERVIPTPQADIAQAGKPSTLPHFPWWAVIAAGTVLVLSGYVWNAGRVRRAPAARPADAESAPTA